MRGWYEINAKDGGPIEVLIFDEIGFWGITADDFRREFDAVAETDRDIVVTINSPGGDVFDGIAIFNAIAKVRDRVTTVVSGVAASIASVIALAGDVRKIDEGSFLMIHNPWAIAIGDAEFMRKRAATLDKIGVEMLSIYENNSSMDRDDIAAAMSDETWYNADEAYQAGFATELGEQEEPIAAAAFNWREFHYRHVPRALVEARRRDATRKDPRELEDDLRHIGYSKRDATVIAGAGLRALKGDPSNDATRSDSGETVQVLREITHAMT